MPEIPKAYDPKAVEDKWYQFWLDQKCFVADPARVSSKRPAYSIVIPPPNVTGVLHMGHVLNNTIQDILARKARMDGKEVLWLPGTDHAGIATQVQVEKALLKEGKTKHDLGREEFLKRVWAWKEKHGGIIIQQLKKLGCSCDWTRERFTMDPEYSRCVQKVFIALYRKGLIYRGKRMVNWDPATRTALSDEEVEMIETRGHLWHLKYPLLDQSGRPIPDQFVVVATTRPETMLGDEAVAVNPKDARYKPLVGRKVLLPLQNKPIPIIADNLVDPEFGTGCVKVTPAHDPNDYEMALRHKLPLTVVIGPDGRMTDAAGARFAGLDRMDARKAVVAELEQQGLLLKVEDYMHNVGYSQRSHVPIEPYLSEQWFLKYPSVEPSLRCVELGAVLDKEVRVVRVASDALPGSDRAKLRESAWRLVREKGWLGRAFLNEDTGWQIYVRRKSLSHAFNNRDPAVIRAVAALPELIRTAVWWQTEPHRPPHPHFKRVHLFLGAMELGGEFYYVPMVVKELADETLLYDHKTKRATPGGKPLVARLPEETLGIQPAPGVAHVKLADILAWVKPDLGKTIRFHPDRWVKTYAH
ncbi:MAG: class I tRNA ligase family protein, partial [Verrucomicrobiae bacterium]|nr:class I tRNA ligase family protein [Verrucomicrobiae bacterium]